MTEVSSLCFSRAFPPRHASSTGAWRQTDSLIDRPIISGPGFVRQRSRVVDGDDPARVSAMQAPMPCRIARKIAFIMARRSSRPAATVGYDAHAHNDAIAR